MDFILRNTDAKHLERVRQWVLRLMDREGYSYRRPTHIAQNANQNMSVCADFVDAVNRKIELHNVSADRVLNLDQTNVPFDIHARVTITRRGSQTVNVEKPKVTGGGRATAALTCAMDGAKLPSFIVFQGKTGGKIDKRELPTLNQAFPDHVRFCVQENA